jgi:hypothetical protein
MRFSGLSAEIASAVASMIPYPFSESLTTRVNKA